MSRTIATILTLNDRMSGGILRASRNVQGMSREMRTATNQAAKMATGFANGVSKMATKIVKFGAIGAATIATIGAKAGFTEAFNMEGFRTQLETATKSTKKAAEIMTWSVKLANATPFETGSIIEMSAKYESMGMSAKKWGGITADMAGATNKDVNQAAEAIIDAQTGELERLKEFGITKAMIGKKANNMFKGQEIINKKGQIVDQKKFNEALMSLMNDKYKGGAAKLANTTKGMWSTIMGVAKTSLANIVGMQNDGTIKTGSLLDTVKKKIKQVADQFTKMQSDGTIDRIAQNVTKTFDVIYKAISKTINFIKDHKSAIVDFGIAFASFAIGIKVANGLRTALKLVKSAIILTDGALKVTTFGLVILGVTLLVGGFILLYKHSAKFRAIIATVVTKLKEFGNYVMTNIVPALLDMATTIKDNVMEAFNFLKPIISDFITNVLMPLINFLVGVFKFEFSIIFPFILNIVKTVFNTMKGVIDGAIKVFGGIIQFITGVFTGDWDKAWKGIVNIFSGIFGGIKAIALGIVNAVIDTINGMTSVINKIPGVNIGVISNVGEKEKSKPTKAVKTKVYNKSNNFGLNIPKHLSGSSYTAAGLALIHEKGGEIRKLSSGETIIPADKSKQLLDKSSKGGIQVFVTIQGNVIGNEEYADYIGNHIVTKVIAAVNNM